jgi:hypothetical protein
VISFTFLCAYAVRVLCLFFLKHWHEANTVQSTFGPLPWQIFHPALTVALSFSILILAGVVWFCGSLSVEQVINIINSTTSLQRVIDRRNKKLSSASANATSAFENWKSFFGSPNYLCPCAVSPALVSRK